MLPKTLNAKLLSVALPEDAYVRYNVYDPDNDDYVLQPADGGCFQRSEIHISDHGGSAAGDQHLEAWWGFEKTYGVSEL